MGAHKSHKKSSTHKDTRARKKCVTHNPDRNKCYSVIMEDVDFSSECEVIETVIAQSRTRNEEVFRRPFLRIYGFRLVVREKRLKMYIETNSREWIKENLQRLLGEHRGRVTKILRSTRGMPRQYVIFDTVVNRYGVDAIERKMMTRTRAITRRVVGSGICYHIYNRTQHKQMLFQSEEERSAMENLLLSIGKKFQCLLHGWCVMENHYHMVVETGIEYTISAIMKWLDWKISLDYNQRHGQSGTIWQGRYGDSVVDRVGDNLLDVLDYVHANPVRAGLVERAEDYRWSSCRFYVNGETREGLVIAREYVNLAGNRKNRARAYLERIKKMLSKDAVELMRIFEKARVIGRCECYDRLKAKCRNEFYVTVNHQVIRKDPLNFLYGLSQFLKFLFPQPEEVMLVQACPSGT